MKTFKEEMKKLGFKMDTSNFGTIEPEGYDVGKHHFKPLFRSVFIGDTFNGHFYITSHIVGKMRLYRHRYWFDTDIANIFGYGKTQSEAIRCFVRNFKAKKYNRNGVN